MDPTKELGPLLGFSLAIWFALCAIGLFTFLALLLVPFSLLAIRRQLDQQLAALQRLEARLAAAESARVAPAATAATAAATATWPAAASGDTRP